MLTAAVSEQNGSMVQWGSNRFHCWLMKGCLTMPLRASACVTVWRWSRLVLSRSPERATGPPAPHRCSSPPLPALQVQKGVRGRQHPSELSDPTAPLCNHHQSRPAAQGVLARTGQQGCAAAAMESRRASVSLEGSLDAPGGPPLPLKENASACCCTDLERKLCPLTLIFVSIVGAEFLQGSPTRWSQCRTKKSPL